MANSIQIPVSRSHAKIPRFLNHIRTAGVPSKVNGDYLKSANFRDNNDNSLISIFKLLGFIDGAGEPTDLWRQYRGEEKHAKVVLGKSIKNAYKGLFELYPDAPSRSEESIRSWIRSNTSNGEDYVNRAMRTFRSLCGEANFEVDEQRDGPASREEASEQPQLQVPPIVSPATTPMSPGNVARPGITINIELQIPPTDDPNVYDNFFAAMRKHLFNGN